MAKKKAQYDPKDDKTDWKTKWDHWVQVLANLTAKHQGFSWKDKNPPPTGNWARKHAHTKINSTLAVVASKISEYNTDYNTGIAARIAKARAKITEAIYGAGAQHGKPTAQHTLGSPDTYATACHDKAGTSVINDMLCICCHAATGTTNECGTGITNCNWRQTPLTKLNDIKAKCMQGTPKTISSSTLRATIATAAARIRNKLDGSTLKHYLGKDATGSNCDGGAGNLCADYTNYYKADATSQGALSIPWMTALAEAAEALETISLAAATARAKEHEIKALIQTAKDHYSTEEPKTQQVQAPAQTASLPGQESKCALQNTTVDQCPEAHCDYDAKTKECNPKAGTEPPVAGPATGRGGTNTVVDCSKHQTQQACKSENKEIKPGQKAVCGWIDYVEGTGKLSKPECRSFSFLINKKFSLTADAFVALLK
ncbi:Trypanosomal VSG domain/Trypanosome variant surface glycoprotein C-terminal domain containing protein, putative [Trypanosoma equiperdum]|uniref:Trypanosomal VSG domain/Trypanosome variant surface glycoprotein C-terminal domain containing protein, putative n=1 Tax=Trypanosoma equiperdum TaxID=5694 RepID=A0A1G4IL49_TRYEQ|nr:Trypanosomal VSG domain/Trypanosome variant surface glycoprotein C-terminal domain containing protein, putative [Trypanosoma equiperdum]